MPSRRLRWAESILRSGHLMRGVLVDAASGVCASAVAECDAAAFEVAEELFPFGVGLGEVLFAGPELPSAGYERPVAADGLWG